MKRIIPIILTILIPIAAAADPCLAGQVSNNTSGKIVVTVANVRSAEGAGVSNNKLGFGPPDYDDAVLRLADPVLGIRLEMRY